MLAMGTHGFVVPQVVVPSPQRTRRRINDSLKTQRIMWIHRIWALVAHSHEEVRYVFMGVGVLRVRQTEVVSWDVPATMAHGFL